MPVAVRNLTPKRKRPELFCRFNRFRTGGLTTAFVLAAIPIASSELVAAASVGTTNSESEITSNFVVMSAQAVRNYAKRASELQEAALAAGSVTYEQVIFAAYGEVVSDAIVREKARWRVGVPNGFEFISDYGLSTVSASVQTLTALPDPALNSTLVAQYEATSNLIGISTSATDFALFHESGHVMQQAALRERGTPAGRHASEAETPLSRVLRAGSIDPTSARRLRYLCSQDEFEVRLQDLNRFHALLVGGRPIMDPFDSVRALVSLGMPLEFEEVERAFKAGGRELTHERFNHFVFVPPQDASATTEAFEDAQELLLVRHLSLRVNQSYWEAVLAKIIFEAPGHL